SGTVLAFARSLGEFGATITFVSNIPGGTRTLPLAVFSLMRVPGANDAILRLVLVSIAIALAALILSEALSRRISARIRGSAP
ncbi:MAG: molybdate ABC transporter permease subunit, partial [Alphaproteobacteria bacterium]|nr:molybdate ABC transporter permease subunit [Alphaproteobacteria bacterium]